MTSYHRTDDIKKKFPETFQEFFGNVTKTCKFFNITRDTYYSWRKADAVWAAKCDEASEVLLDKVEETLQEIIFVDKVPSAVFFFLKTKGRSRGYIERTEIENTETVEVKLSASDQEIIEQYLNHSKNPNNSEVLTKSKKERMQKLKKAKNESSEI